MTNTRRDSGRNFNWHIYRMVFLFRNDTNSDHRWRIHPKFFNWKIQCRGTVYTINVQCQLRTNGVTWFPNQNSQSSKNMTSKNWMKIFCDSEKMDNNIFLILNSLHAKLFTILSISSVKTRKYKEIFDQNEKKGPL